MRGTLVLAVVLLMSFVLTASAGAAAPTPAEKKLQGQVTTLNKQVTSLNKTVKKLQTQVKDLQNVVSGALAINICSAAITADALQGTWAAVNAREQATGQLPIFAAESAVNDASACTAAKVTRAPTANPPNLTPFKALLSIFQSFG
jgi:septal ring factor EnvC (AmiA/AmiB activator)